MTAKELIDNILSIEGLSVMVRSVADDKALIFRFENAPIASIYLKAFEYNVEYEKLLDLELEDILKINDWMFDYVNTDIPNRKTDMFFLS